MQLIDMNMRNEIVDGDKEESTTGTVGDEDILETLASIQQKLSALHASFDIVEVTRQQDLAQFFPSESSIKEAELRQFTEADEALTSPIASEIEVKKESESIYANHFLTTSSSRRGRAPRNEQIEKATSSTEEKTSTSSPNITSLTSPISQTESAFIPISPSPQLLASLAVPAEYDDEVSAELWLLQRQYFIQVNHNNYMRSYLEGRARASGDWKVSAAQIEHKEKQDKDTLDLYEESFLLSMARQQRATRRAKYELSEAGQIRNIKQWEEKQQRCQRHIQRLMKSMLAEVERRDKKRQVDERRHASAAQREAKRLRRQEQEAQWKNRREAEIHRRCENAIEHIIRTIEREQEPKPISHKKQRDPNAPPKERKKKEKEETKEKGEKKAKKGKEKEKPPVQDEAAEGTMRGQMIESDGVKSVHLYIVVLLRLLLLWCLLLLRSERSLLYLSYSLR